ncbi:hypothetical protein, partial [Serratia marcescens]
YKKDRKIAYLMGSMILSKAEAITNWNIANKRITWCVRTYILSLMAEQKSPIFSKEGIAFYGCNLHDSISYHEYLALVNAKLQKGYSVLIINLLKRFLVEIAENCPDNEEAKDLLTNESILVNTFEQMMFDIYH